MKGASSGDSLPKMVIAGYKESLPPQEFIPFPACLVKKDTILRFARGVLEIHHVKPTDHELTYELDDDRRECYAFLDVKGTDELQVYQDSVKLSFVDFMLKYSTDHELENRQEDFPSR